MKRFLLFSALTMCAFSTLLADPVTPARARTLAQNFFHEKGWGTQAAPLRAKAMRMAEADADAFSPYYIYNAAGRKGFVVIAGDDCLPAVLGYCETATFDTAAAPAALNGLLQAYGQRAKQPAMARRMAGGTAVLPLLRTSWPQTEPFNNSCPVWTYADGTTSTERCLVGCVATSVSQVLNYYKYPAVLQDTLFGWSTPNYTIPDVPKGTSINWTDIADDYRGAYTAAQAKAVADFSYLCGVSVHMNWGLGASGASMWNIVPNLRRAFGYKYARAYDHFLYTPQQWSAMLHRELEAGRPIIYAGSNVELTSHAFNIDGCDADGLYHINWGYGGDFDGYFDIDVLNGFESPTDATPEGIVTGLFCNQSAVFLHPDSIDLPEPDTLAVLPTDVTVDSVRFSRAPDTNKYLRVDFYLYNHRADTLAYPMEIMLYQPSDTAIFAQADYVGLTGGMLLPQQQTKVSAYCYFKTAGTYTFAYSYDDVHIPYTETITVLPANAPQLVFGGLAPTAISEDEATLSLNISNAVDAGWAGNLVTYCLFQEGVPEDVRRWTFLDLAPGTSLTDSKTFVNLQPGTTYTLKVRCPWAVVEECTFTTPGTNGIAAVEDEPSTANVSVHTLDGRLVGFFPRKEATNLPLKRGIYIVDGKKRVVR